jgi:hypothetical protein
MSKADNNPILNGVSGMLGGTIIFRQVNGRTIISKAPPKREKPTPHQEKTKARFLQGVAYAREQMKVPYLKALYSKGVTVKKTNPYTVALADFLRAPTIHMIVVSKYNGRIGSIVRVEAADDFQVVSVTVSIFDHENVLLEAGEAVLETDAKWTYAAMVENDKVMGSRVVVVAADRPGNKTKKETVIA